MSSEQQVIHSQDSRDSADRHMMETAAMVNADLDTSLSAMMVEAAQMANRAVTDNCGLCTIYCDKQIQYEVLSTEFPSDSITKMYQSSPEVQEARSQLFDEESVVNSMSSR